MDEFEPRHPAARWGLRMAAGAAVLATVFGIWKLSDAYGSRKPAANLAAASPAVAIQPAPGFTAPQPVQVQVERGETLELAVRRLGVSAEEARQAVLKLAEAMDIAHIQAGLALNAAVARPRAGGGPVRLVGLSLRTGPASTLSLSRSFDGALRLREQSEPVHDDTAVADGRIDDSLYETAAELGAPPAITDQVIKLFAHKLDFQRDIQPGDEFKLVYDRQVTETGRLVSAGDLQYAELHGVKFYRFEHNGDVDYFDETGKNIKGFLLRTPVDGARITSRFGLRRHPILGYTRAHRGIDFGAGTGTPILAAGDGVVVEAGRRGGYGNWLRIRHKAGWDTGYGHISRYAHGIRRGVHVHQGQVVAYVGATGLATGPHLHYEVWRHGKQVNPLSAKAPQGTTLTGRELAAFKVEKVRIDGLLQGGASAVAVAVAQAGPSRSSTSR